MSHFDYISRIAPGFEITAHTADCPVAAAENADQNCMRSSSIRRCFTPQREPRCFIILCAASATVPETGGWIPLWKVRSRRFGKRWATGKFSWPCPAAWILPWRAGLLSKAIGRQLTCVFVDHGLLRKNEGDEVEAVFGPEGDFDLNFIRVNAQKDIMGSWLA